MQKAIDSIEPAEHQAIIKRWVAFGSPAWTLDTRSLVIAAVVLFLVAITMIVYWNLSLKRQVRQRTARPKRELGERERAEKALSASERTLRIVFDSVYDAIFIFDLNGDIQRVNQRTLEMFGVTGDEVSHMNVSRDFSAPCEQLERFPEIWRKVCDGETLLFEWRARRPHDHRIIDVEVFLQRISPGRGNVILATVRDISERKKMETIKNEFVSTVSHELRTPLTSIQGSLGLVLGGICGQLPERSRELLEMTQRNSDRLLCLINDILDIEKLEAGKMVFDMRTLDLVELVRTAVEMNRAYAGRLGIKLKFYTELASAAVLIDPDRCAQVMANLISNAAKFSPADGTVEVELSCNG